MVLIQHGADVTARDKTDSTPLHLASSKGSSNTVKLLIQHGADANAKDGRHATPLHLAASSHLSLKGNVVRLLLDHGANVMTRMIETKLRFRLLPREDFLRSQSCYQEYRMGYLQRRLPTLLITTFCDMTQTYISTGRTGPNHDLDLMYCRDIQRKL